MRAGPDEARHLDNVNRLFRKAAANGRHFIHELTGLNLPVGANYWGRLELCPQPPKAEAELWNYLALCLTDQAGVVIPDFLQPATELAPAREAMPASAAA